MKIAPDGNAFPPPHLNHAQLVAYQDGELSRPEMESARAHLESCWPCRSRLTAVQGSIENFLGARAKRLPDPAVIATSRTEQFRQRLARHAAAVAALPLSLSERLFAWRNQLRHLGRALLQPRRSVPVGLAAAFLLAALFSGVLNPGVSADTVLLRAESYEAAHLPGRGLVTHSLVRVERIDRASRAAMLLGTIVVVHDSALPVAYLDLQPSSGSIESTTIKDDQPVPEPTLAAAFFGSGVEAPLLQYLAAQRWTPDVSIAGFRRLVAARGDTTATARREGDSLELRYPFAPGHRSGITEALLVVDQRDYSPASISVITAHQGASWEYRFTRTSFSSEPRNLELARLNSVAATSASSPGRSATVPPLRRAVPLSYANSSASDSEVAAAAALHRVDVCLGEEVNLFPMSDGSLLVQGLVDSSARREVIRLALRLVAGPLRVEVFVPRELKSGSELYNPPDQFGDKLPAGGGPASRATLADFSSASMPLHDELYRHFAQSGGSPEEISKQVAVYSNEVVTLAQQTFLHAWALKRLDREFSRVRTAGLSPAALEQVEQMRQDHRRWISTLAHRQAEMLSEIPGAALAAPATQVDAGQQDSETLLRLAQEQNDLVRALFTTSQPAPETASSLARLLAVLRRMGT